MERSTDRITPDRGEDLDIGAYVDKKILGSVFSGYYSDRCYVEALQYYRDRIQIDPEEETVLKNLRSVLRRLKKQAISLPGKEFFGIEKIGEKVSVYVDWSNTSQPFGHYWFMVERATVFRPRNLLQLQIKVLRPISTRDFASSQKCPHCGKLPFITPEGDPLDLSEVARQMQEKFGDLISPTEWWNEARPHLTLSNVGKLVKFSFLVLMAAVSGGSALFVKTLSLLNRTIHEMGFFIRQATPFLMACLEMVNKIIGGFYLLLAMMWRDARRPEIPPQSIAPRYAAIQGPKYPYMRKDVQRPYLTRPSMD